MQPVQYNNLKIYKGATFKFEFRLKHCTGYADPTDVIFNLAEAAGGTEVYEKRYAESPQGVTYDADTETWTVILTEDETADIDKGTLYFFVDAIESGERIPWIIGNVTVYAHAPA